MSMYEKFVKLHLKRDKLKAQLEDNWKEIETLQERLLDVMTQDGLSKASTPFGNLRIDRTIRASAGGDMSALIEAMKVAGEGEMVAETVNGTRLGAWVREFDPANNLSPAQIEAKLPEPLRGKIKITEQIQIKVTGRQHGKV